MSYVCTKILKNRDDSGVRNKNWTNIRGKAQRRVSEETEGVVEAGSNARNGLDCVNEC